MSEVNQQETNQHEIEKADIDERFEALGKMVEAIDNDYSRLHKHLNDEMLYFHERIENKIKNELSDIRSEVSKTLADLREQFVVKVQERVQAASSAELSEAFVKTLQKAILVTRPANREELKTGTAIAIRQASRAELRN
jgi:hypothetical protein